MNRKRLLDAVRGIYRPAAAFLRDEYPLRCFKLQNDHVKDALSIETPDRFHGLLCRMIRDARHRVYLASLYIGPAASEKDVREHELLDALRFAASDSEDKLHNPVQVKILMDKNRALRPVPISETELNHKRQNTTSSAEAVLQAIQSQHDDDSGEAGNENKVFLFSVLPPILQHILPNPYNEVAGVFHMKAYIIDDCLLISGANLSEEYFCDRHDRYLLVSNGGAGLVDFYASLVDILCDHAELYSSVTTQDCKQSHYPTTREELLASLNTLFTSPEQSFGDDFKKDIDFENDSDTAVYVVPTFQAPKSFFSDKALQFLSDMQATQSLLQAILEQKDTCVEIRLSTAYLNLTDSMISLFSGFKSIKLLTAGSISHGFAPKKKAGNKRLNWIPKIFHKLSTEAASRLNAELWYYERPGWTFHSKGLWIMEESNQDQNSRDVAAVICGSSNFGARSQNLDLESNCFLVLPKSPKNFHRHLTREWQQLCDHSNLYTNAVIDESIDEMLVSSNDEQMAASTAKRKSKEVQEEGHEQLSWPLQMLLPACRKLF